MRFLVKRLVRILKLVLSGHFRLIWYRIWTRIKGLDLSGVSPEELGLSPTLAVEHSNSGGPLLEVVLKQALVSVTSRIVDFGSGKGGATFTMAKFPFAEIVGVEVSPELVAIAQDNARRLRIDSRIRFVCSDATDFVDLDRFTHVYLFNPFAPEIAQRVYENLVASLKRCPRTLMVICKYPEGGVYECLPQSGRLQLVAKIEFKFSHPFYLFTLTT
jgi:SAM-dependent methyltransferase